MPAVSEGRLRSPRERHQRRSIAAALLLREL